MRLPTKYAMEHLWWRAGNTSNGGIACICHLVPRTFQVSLVVNAYLVYISRNKLSNACGGELVTRPWWLCLYNHLQPLKFASALGICRSNCRSKMGF